MTQKSEGAYIVWEYKRVELVFYEDTQILRRKSELFDLLMGYANSRAFWPNGFQGAIHRRILEENIRLYEPEYNRKQGGVHPRTILLP